MDRSELPDLEFVGQGQDSPVEAPWLAGSEPRIYKAEGGELSPWQRLQLDKQYVEIAQVAVGTQIKQAESDARIRDTDATREATHREWDERRQDELETARWERQDRRVERYVFLVIFLLGTIAAIVLAFMAVDTRELQITPSAPLAVSILAGLRLRSLRNSDSASFWGWLIHRQEKNKSAPRDPEGGPG
jgi:ABC-type multidrug transport system fused ATPase/permease subunit